MTTLEEELSKRSTTFAIHQGQETKYEEKSEVDAFDPMHHHTVINMNSRLHAQQLKYKRHEGTKIEGNVIKGGVSVR